MNYMICKIQGSGESSINDFTTAPESIQDVSTHCRLCLKPGAIKNLNEKISNLKTISDKLSSLLNMKIHPSDGLPGKICAVCYVHLKACLNFIWKCKVTDKKLRSIIKNIKPVKNTDNTIYIKQESSEIKLIKSEKGINENIQIESLKEKKIKNEVTERIDGKEEPPYSNNDEFKFEVSVDYPDDHDYGEKSEENPEKKPSMKDLEKIYKEKHTKKGSQCTVCGKILRGSMTEHMKRHTGERPFACNYCDKTFNAKSTLLSHIRIHTNEKPFSCDECGERFNFSSGLRVHKLNHSGLLPHVCSYCGKAFKTSGTMQLHVKQHHSTVRDFKCPECNFAGVTKSVLSKHYGKVHSTQYKEACKICGKVLSRGHHMKRHMMIHTGEKPHECKHCPARFIQKSDMLKHQKGHEKSKARQDYSDDS